MKTQLKAALAALASLALLAGGTAVAADLGSSRLLPPAPDLPAFYSWTGAYAGVQGGYSWGNDRVSRFLNGNGVGATSSYSTDSALGGGHVGFNYQFGSIVLGIEGDAEAVNARGGYSDAGVTGRVQRDWQGSVRGRIGYAFDRFMIYGTGGAAFTEFDYRVLNPATGLGERMQNSATGWNIGAGVNFAFTDNLILGAEYRYTDYGKVDHLGRGAVPGLVSELEPKLHTVRASVAYKF